MGSINQKSQQLKQDVVFYGMAGAGKTTQARKIAQYFGAHFFSIGEVLREIAGQETELGRVARYHTERGTYPDDEIHYQIYKEGTQQAAPGQTIIFEGVGRLPRLKKVLDRVEEERGSGYLVIYLKVNEEVAFQRVLQQKKRNDLTSGVIKNRFRIFQEETLPVIEQQRQERIVLEIDATVDLDLVTENIITELAVVIG